MLARYYQQAAQDNVISNSLQGKNKNLVVIPVGGGKSIVIGHLALWALHRFPGKKALLVAHRKELSTQNAAKIQAIDPEIHLGFEKAQERCPKEANIMMASILTIGKPELKRLREWAQPSEIAIILIDEAHHIPGSQTYQTLIKEIQAENPNVLIVGFTATPKRGDGEKIEDWIDTLAYEISMAELVENKYLARINAFKIKTQSSMGSLVGAKRKDFDDRELEKLLNNEARNQLALDTYLARHQGDNALAFCISKAHARNVAALFQKAGIPAASITEDTPEKEREELIASFKEGTLKVLTCVMTLTEGFDSPNIKALLMLRPTKSPVLFEQMVGRGLRLIAYQDPENPDAEWLIDWGAKSFCSIYDFVDQQATEAGSQTLPKMLGLHPDLELEGQDIFSLKAKSEALSEGDTLLQAAIAQARSPEEIESLLQGHNLLAEIQALHYAPGQNAQWIELPNEEAWIQLPHGETARVFKNALGTFQLFTPPLALEPRRKNQKEYLEKFPDREPIPIPEGEFLILGENGTTHLASESLKTALKEATTYLLQHLPWEAHLISSKASWRKKAAEEPATEGQLKQLARLKVTTQEDPEKPISKALASELIDKAQLQKKISAAQGRIPFGQYIGVPLWLVHLYDKRYFDWLLSEKADLLAKNQILEAAQVAPTQNPVPLLKDLRPRLYHKDFAGMEDFYTKAWEKDPADVLATVKFALDHDPIPPWPLILSRKKQK